MADVRHVRSLLISLALIPAIGLLVAGSVQRGAMPAAAPDARVAWLEPDAPFFSSVLDARKAGAGLPSNNLTPRALVLNLGGGYWAAFDTDLLRVAAVWQGAGVTPRALAPGSYHEPDRKTPGGQSSLPEPDGTVWLANGIYPGWQAAAHVSLDDPRAPAPSPDEVGRGPLPAQDGRFEAVRLVSDGAVLEYTVGGAAVREWMTLGTGPSVERHFSVAPSTARLWLVVGFTAPQALVALGGATGPTPALESLAVNGGAPGSKTGSLWTVQVPPHREPLRFAVSVAVAPAPDTAAPLPRPLPAAAPARRWPQDTVSRVTRSTAAGAYVVDEIALPTDNRWRRAVRPGDIQFLRDGTAAVVTLDGDVWLAAGLDGSEGLVRWRRFASGLHEPLTLAIRDEQIYVFDRNGIWRLRDSDANGEADVHELFSNAFAQTADMREFPSTLRLAPDGEFVIAKGGQEAATLGKHNGSVLRISADGRRATVLGYGFRQPNLGVNVRTGLVTASDQQGHYIPTTPLHIVRDRQFYGFLSDKRPREVYPAPIAAPLTWIPHAANASAMSQVWLFGARMGPLNDGLVHIGFNNPELFRVLLHERGASPQAAVVSITRAFDFPPLNGSVNPADGQLYLAGFQILGWGTTATRLAGVGRVRYTGASSTLPREVVAMDQGVLLRFDSALDPDKAVDPDNYSLTSWHYKRTFQYGSPQFKADGTPGIDRIPPGRVYLAKDGRSVFIAVAGMKPVMQMRLGWTLATAEGAVVQDTAYFTPYDLPAFEPVAAGFGNLSVDSRPGVVAESAPTPVSVAEGRRLAHLYGCVACHAIDRSTVTRLGPSWNGLFGSQRTYAKGVLRVTADERYLRESILEPSAKIVSGYERGEAGMPSYAGVLSEPQIDAIILFITRLP